MLHGTRRVYVVAVPGFLHGIAFFFFFFFERERFAIHEAKKAPSAKTARRRFGGAAGQE